MLDKKFREREKELQEKLMTVQMGKLDKAIEPPKPIQVKSNPYGNYYKYHKKWQSHPDNWRKIGE